MISINRCFSKTIIINVAILFILSVLISSCYHVNENEIVIPDPLLTDSQMVEILTEVQIAEAGFSISKNRSKAKKLKPEYYNRILSEYGITLKQLKDNIDYYQNYPKEIEEIYENVLANLSRLQSDVLIEKEEFEKKRVADSIYRVADSINQLKADSLANVKLN